MRLYEILIPVNYNDGTPIPDYLRQEWIRYATVLAGGSTVRPNVRGQWYYNGHTYDEPMTPVQIAVPAPEGLDELVTLAKEWFQQETIMYYVISNEVYFV